MMRLHYNLLLASLLAACGQEKDDQPVEIAPPGKSASTIGGNGEGDNSGPDTGIDDTGEALDIDGVPFEPDSVEGVFYSGEDSLWILTAKEGDTWLYIENYPNFGGATGAETRTLGAVEVDYATCGVCVLLKTGCAVHGDHAHCETTYMPQAGSSVTFDELSSEAGGAWSGSLSPIRFVEVSINGSTYETTPVTDGQQIELDTWSFDVTLVEG